MECPNCGQGLPAGVIGVVRCTYCRSSVAMLSHAETIVSSGSRAGIPKDERDRLSRMLALGNIDLESGHYSAALAAYDAILSEYPDAWEALVNKAICVFWLGREDLEHMGLVESLLRKAAALSGGDALVEHARYDIAYNLVSIASGKERFGSEIFWIFECIRISHALVGEHEARDAASQALLKALYSDAMARILRGFSNSRLDYDPPASEVAVVSQVALLSGDEECIKSALAVSRHKQSRFRVDASIAGLMDSVIQLYQSRFPGSPLPSLVFSKRGEPIMQ